VTKKNSDHH